MPAKPRWLLAIPDAISQLEQLDRDLLTRRDIERFFGVGKVRAAALMKMPVEIMSAKLADLPDGVSVERGRIEVRFDGAEDALARLYALAQALGNDLGRFQALAGR